MTSEFCPEETSADLPAGQTKTLIAFCKRLDDKSNAKKRVRILLDGASNRSLCKRSLANLLEANGEPTDLTMQLAGGNVSKTTRESKVWLCLESLDGDYKIPIQVTTTKKVGMMPPINFNPKDFSHLSGLKFTEKFPVKREISIDILVGEPIYSHLLLGNPVLREMEEPGAQRTKLGWAVCAADPSSVKEKSYCYAVSKRNDQFSVDKLSVIMSKFWDLEVIGVPPPPVEESKYTAEEQAAIDSFQAGATYDKVERRWTVRLPWLNEKPQHDSTLAPRN